MGWEQDESIDTFAYGNNIYTLVRYFLEFEIRGFF